MVRAPICIGVTCGSLAASRCASGPTRTSIPPLPLAEQHMRSCTMKQTPPIIFRSDTSFTSDSSARIRAASFSS
jgi:hypothetical protein